MDAAATAQDAYRRMLREYIAPALRELGFRRGPSPGAFRHETATHACEVRFRKSRGSTPQYVDFWADLHTSDLMDNPGYPRDPTVRWARTFPKIPRGPLFDDEVAAERQSWRALDEAMAQADRDSSAFQAVLTLLETDPHPGIRHAAAWFLLQRVGEERSRQALRAAATEDEDVQVRWVARYAFRLAERQTSTDAAGPAPE